MAYTNFVAAQVLTAAQVNSVAGFKASKVYTVNGTFTSTDLGGKATIRVTCIGGGAGAGGAALNAAGNSSAGGGGGGGGFAQSILDASTLTYPVTVTVAVGVAGGTAGVAGTAGNSSSFGTYVVAGGGGAGGAGTTGLTLGLAGNGGVGGTPTAGDIQIVGGDGIPGYRFAAGTTVAGIGGGAACVGTLRKQSFSNQSDGAGALSYGQGGSGGVSQASGGAQNGGAGGSGLIIVEFI